MKKEYAIVESWVSYELHPETPSSGVLLAARFQHYDLPVLHEQIRVRGLEFDLVFGSRTHLFNSRKALAAAEFARDLGKFDSFHENMFQAYFTHCLDIDNPDVIAAVAVKSGLDEKEILCAVQDGRYMPRLDDARKEAESLKLTSIPLFIINDKYKVIGAQPMEIFRDLLDNIE